MIHSRCKPLPVLLMNVSPAHNFPMQSCVKVKFCLFIIFFIFSPMFLSYLILIRASHGKMLELGRNWKRYSREYDKQQMPRFMWVH